MTDQNNPDERRSSAALLVATITLIAAILGGNLFFINNLRDSLLLDAESDLARYSLMLAEQTDRSFKSVDLMLASVGDYLSRRGVTDGASYDRLTSSYETFRLLKEKISGLPYVEAIGMIDADGQLVSSSRAWPIPDVNVSDRDYFLAPKRDRKLETFISMPARNRVTGTWNIYVSRRINDPHGVFMGIVVGAISLDYFENFFGSTVMGADGQVAMTRDDGTLLARFPRSDLVGNRSQTAAQRALHAGGTIRETFPGEHDERIISARLLPNYPIAIAVNQTETSALAEWRHMAALLAVTSLGCCLLVVMAAVVIARWWHARERAASAALAASHAKSSFLAMMSHEIRTPMNAVLGLSATLLNTQLSNDQRQSVVAIHNAGDNLLELLNDILDFSRLESGRLSFEAIAFAPDSLADNTLSVMGPRAAAKGLALKTTKEPTLPAALTGDVGRIRQVLLNLVSNAIKFTESGEVTLAIRCLARDGERATIEWSVSDTGIGIAPDRLKDLFKDFVQADNSINRRFGGSGLGLSICKRIVERHHGRIWVEPNDGGGSRFCFTIPDSEAAETTTAGPADEGSGRMSDRTTGEGSRQMNRDGGGPEAAR